MSLVADSAPGLTYLESIWPVIHKEMELRREARQPVLNHMQDVQHRYNGEWAVPYPNKDQGPDLPPLGPAIIADAIDHTGMNAGSVQPDIFCPSLDPDTATHNGRARKRKQSLQYMWHQSGFKLLSRKWFRHLAGYGTFGIMVKPDFDRECPILSAIDPLSAFPEERHNGSLEPPRSVGIVHVLHKDAIVRMFPHASSSVRTAGKAGVISPDAPQMWEVVEWVDERQRVWGILGPRDTWMYRAGAERHRESHQPLHWAENPIGLCPVIMPERVTLDKVISQVRHILGMTDLQSRLMALDILSSEKSIFPDRVIVGSSTNPPVLADGKWHDGIDGQPNIVYNAEQVLTLGNSPDPNVKIGMDRLERNAKVSGGLVPQQQGETPGGGLRTGRANDALYASAVEPRLQEYHEIAEHWLPHANVCGIETYKTYWPSKKYVVFTGVRGQDEMARFKPSTHLDDSSNSVNYAIPGANATRITIELSQMLATEAISMQDYRRMHPNIADAESTEQQVNIEAMERSLRRMVEVGIENQTLAIEDQVVLLEELKRGTELVNAVAEMQRASQERQEELLRQQQEAQQGELVPGALPGANPAGADQVPGLQGLPQPEGSFGPNPNQAGLFNLIGATQKGLR